MSSYPSSGFGFINVPPKTREYRRSLKDKVALERRLLNDRVGHEARMHQRNAPETSAGLTACVENGAGYLPNAERFHSDTSGEEYALRQHALEKKKQMESFRREQSANREDSRWARMEEEKRMEREHWEKKRESGQYGQKNKSKTAYDIVSLDYLNTDKGKEQQYNDDMVKYRAHLRSQNLISKSNTSGNYNIISGAPMDVVAIDPRRRPERK